MILGRVLQFIRAVSARVSPEDKAFVERNLPHELCPLFFAMSVPDQCHALRVARNATVLAENDATEIVDLSLLLRCSLLHDVGRKNGEMGTFWKSFAVLFDAACPNLARDYGDKAGDGLLVRKMRVYYYHPKIGAEVLAKSGFLREAEIIRKHHEAPADKDPPELRILRIADKMS